MNILLTFTGFHDPYTLGLIGGEEVPGPILSLLAVRSFDHVILFDTPNTRENTRLTRAALEAQHPSTSVEVRDAPLTDPTDYLEILAWLRRHFQEISVGLSPGQLLHLGGLRHPPDARLLAAAGGQWGTAGHAAQYPPRQIRHRGPAPPGGG